MVPIGCSTADGANYLPKDTRLLRGAIAAAGETQPPGLPVEHGHGKAMLVSEV